MAIRWPKEPTEPVSTSLKDADLVETIRAFCRIAGISVVVHPEIQGSITADLKNLNVLEALGHILRAHNLKATNVDDVIHVSRLEQSIDRPRIGF